LKIEDGSFKTEMDRIKKLNWFQVIGEILSYYECPGECRGTCCRVLPIPVSAEEEVILGRASRKNKKILEKLVPSGKVVEFMGDKLDAGKVFSVMPCPFLKDDNSRCQVYRIRPIACKIYPFQITAQEDKKDKVRFEVALCMMGCDIFIDFLFFNVGLTGETIRKEDFDKLVTFIKEKINLDKTKRENIFNAEFTGFQILQMFLGYLNFNVLKERVEKREEFKKKYLLEDCSDN
jgi:Fe-S-cluster containining protein